MATTAVTYANQPSTTVSSGGTTAPASGTSESWTVASSASFPAASNTATPPTQFHVADTANGKTGEIIAVTNVSGTTWTVTRGAENTATVAHAAGFTVVQVVSAGDMGSLLQSANNLSDVAVPATARTNLGLGAAAALGIPIPVADGGTGQVTQQAALDALAGAVTASEVLAGNGTHVTLRALAAADLAAIANEQGYTQLTLNPDGTLSWGKPWQFSVMAYGAKGDGKAASDVTISSGTLTTLTTVGLDAPSAPAISNSGSGGSIGAGTYTAKVTLVNAHGETAASAASSSTTTTGSASTITVNKPAGNRDATGWNVYLSSGGSWFLQNTSPLPMGQNHTFTSFTGSGTTAPSSNTSQTTFTAGDVGKTIVVSQAGGSAHTPLITTISGFTNSTTVTLASGASAGGVTKVGAIWGTDDTTAIQNAVNAAVAYAQAQTAGYAEVVFPPAYYIVAGAPVTGGTTLGNSQITLPAIDPTTGPKVTLKLTGMTDVTAPPDHWLQPTLTAPGSVLVCANSAGTYSSTYGPSAVIGGPVSGYGGGNGLFSNMYLVVEGLTCLLPWSTTIGGMNLFGIGQATVKSFSVMPMAVPSGASSSAWPALASGPPDNQYPAGLIMPDVGNNAVNDIGYYTVYGQFIGLAGSDHLTWHTLRTIYCNTGWLPTATNTSQPHTTSGLDWCCESTQNPVQVFNSAGWSGYAITQVVSMNIAALSIESYATYIVSGDSNGFLAGVIWFEDVFAAAHGTHGYHGLLVDINTVKLLSVESNPGPVSSPQAPPSSASAWFNLYYRDAEITLSVATGSLSALTIDSTAQTVPASTTFYRFTLPSGHSYTPTYTGTLSHTVTLL